MYSFKKVLKLIWNEFIYGGHFQSLGAASIVFVSGILLKIQITWDILFITYLLFYALYLYNRLKEIKIDSLTNLKRTQHFRRYLGFIPIIFYSAVFILVVSLVYFSNLKALIFGLFLFVFGILYTLIFKRLTQKVPFLKNFYVSIFFASLVFLPIIYYSYPLKTVLIVSGLVLGLFIFLKAFISQIFLDIKDIESDREQKLRTFPIIIGEKNTFTILSIFNFLITIIIPVGFSFYFNIFPRSMLMLIFTIPFSFYCYSLAKKQKYFGYILQSGEFLLWPPLILLGEIIL